MLTIPTPRCDSLATSIATKMTGAKDHDAAQAAADRRISSESAQSTHSRSNSIRAPILPPNQNGTSPLAKAGIKGDSLMLFITCFASLGVFLFGYDQGVMVRPPKALDPIRKSGTFTDDIAPLFPAPHLLPLI